MSERWMSEMTELARRLLPLAASDAGLRAALRALATELLQATGSPEPGPAAAGVEDRASSLELPPATGPRVPLRPLTLGQRVPEPLARPPVSEPGNDLSGLIAHCRRMADAARLAAERQRRIQEGVDPAELDDLSDPETETQAQRLTHSFFWASVTDEAWTADVSRLDHVGGCYEAVASSLALAVEGGDRKGNLDRLLPLVAEAQSALRRALQTLGVAEDPDQVEVYKWVRDTAARQRIFLRRYLRADDLADPSGWPDLLARIEAIAGTDSRSRQVSARLEQVRDQQTRIREGQGSDDDWQAVLAAVDELVGQGTPPSHRDLREFLLPIVDEIPTGSELSPGVRIVLREVDRFLATRPTRPRAEFGVGLTDEVAQAARFLQGRSVVLIGGVRRPEAQKLLKSAFGLRELIWVTTREHQSIKPFESFVARPDVALVLLAIRWTSHAFGDVKQFCDRHGKLLVRLPGGYGPNQVAAQILSQCSEKLGEGATEPAE